MGYKTKPIGLDRVIHYVKEFDIRRSDSRETNERKTVCKACGNDVLKGEGEPWVRFYNPDRFRFSEFILCKPCHKKVIEAVPTSEDDCT